MADQRGRRQGAFGLRFAVLGCLVVVALGLTADPPGELSQEPWSLPEPAPETVGAVLLGCLALGALLGLLGLLRSPDGAPARPRSSSRSLLLLLAVVAALIGYRVLRPSTDGQAGPPPDVPPTPTPTPTPGPAGAGEVGAAESGGPLLGLLVVLVVAVLVALLASRRAAPEPEAEPVAPDLLGIGLAAAAGSLRTSDGDDPRSRVIDAYEAFEGALGERLRSPSTTPAGLLAAAIAEGAPEGPAARLTELFTAARFADRRLTARDVAEAEQALDALLAAR